MTEGHIVSVRFDERPFEWRVVADSRGHPALVEDIVTPPPMGMPGWVRGHRTLTVGEPAADGGTLLLVAVSGQLGALYFRQIDRDGVAHGWVSHNPDPVADAPALPFSSQGWNSFPPTAVMPRERLRKAITEFLATGQRPGSVAWRESEWVQ